MIQVVFRAHLRDKNGSQRSRLKRWRLRRDAPSLTYPGPAHMNGSVARVFGLRQ